MRKPKPLIVLLSIGITLGFAAFSAAASKEQ
jgi:hypothetical protein